MRVRWLKAIAAGASATLLAVACGGTPSPATAGGSAGGVAQELRAEGAEVNLYWPANSNFQQFVSQVLAPGFEDYTKKMYGVAVHVNVLQSGGGDAAFLQKLQANGTQPGFDIDVARTAPSTTLLQVMDDGLLEPLSGHRELPNLTMIDRPGRQTFTHAGKVYGAAVYRPTMSLFYNANLVPNPPRSLAELLSFAKAHPGKVSYEDPRSTTGTGSGTMFLLTVMHAYANPVDRTNWSRGWSYLRQLQQWVTPEPATGDQLVDLFQRGEIEVMPYWNDAGLFARDELKISGMKNLLIKEGFPVRYTPLVIPAGAAHKEAALLLVNYALSPEIQRKLATMMHQIPASTAPSIVAGLPAQTFGFPLSEIDRTSFPSYNSSAALAAIADLNASYATEVLGR
ncbi:MAG TPA: extracellular solute-binding protein [Candidatus Dormibacteraeota bacterium]|nr:extracellular solute-binding protein [Candidatus Dormibacteraeota bacterium]